MEHSIRACVRMNPIYPKKFVLWRSPILPLSE